MNQTAMANINPEGENHSIVSENLKAHILPESPSWKHCHFSNSEFNEFKKRVPTWQISENLDFPLLDRLLHEASKTAESLLF